MGLLGTFLVLSVLAYRKAFSEDDSEGSWSSDVVRQERTRVIDAPADRFFVDVAMSPDGEHASTGGRHLESKRWRGLCAFPFSTSGMTRKRSCNVVSRAVGPVSGESVAVSNCRWHWAAIEAYVQSWFSGEPYFCPQVHVSTLSIEDLLLIYSAPKVIDFMALDTHGSELEVLQGFPFEDYCVRSWSVKGWSKEDAIHKFLEVSHGCRARSTHGLVTARCPCQSKSKVRTKHGVTGNVVINHLGQAYHAGPPRVEDSDEDDVDGDSDDAEITDDGEVLGA